MARLHERRLHERRTQESAEYDAARVRLGMSKADLAREIGKNPQVVRRLFSAETRNPELKTVAAIASALGGRVRVDFPDAVGH